VKTTGRRCGFFARSDALDAGERESRQLVVEEEDGRQCLVLRGGRDAAVGSEVREPDADVGGAQPRRVALAVEEDEVTDPGDVGLLGTDV